MEVGGVIASSGGHQFIYKRRGAIQQQAEWTELEVRVLLETLMVSLISVKSKVALAKVALASTFHHAEHYDL